SRRDGPRQPAPEFPEAGRRNAAGTSVGRDAPDVTRSAAGLKPLAARDQPGCRQALQVNPDAVWVQAEAAGQLDRFGRAPELGQELEEPSARRLGQRVGRADGWR